MPYTPAATPFHTPQGIALDNYLPAIDEHVDIRWEHFFASHATSTSTNAQTAQAWLGRGFESLPAPQFHAALVQTSAGESPLSAAVPEAGWWQQATGIGIGLAGQLSASALAIVVAAFKSELEARAAEGLRVLAEQLIAAGSATLAQLQVRVPQALQWLQHGAEWLGAQGTLAVSRLQLAACDTGETWGADLHGSWLCDPPSWQLCLDDFADGAACAAQADAAAMAVQLIGGLEENALTTPL